MALPETNAISAGPLHYLLDPQMPESLVPVIGRNSAKNDATKIYEAWGNLPGDDHVGFLAQVLAHERTIALVWEETPGTVDGFIIANIIAAPPVYEPGGPTCMVDDYWVRGGERWETIGHALLDAVCIRARSRLGNRLRMVRERAQVMGILRNSCRYQ